jgi:hypothetical protein
MKKLRSISAKGILQKSIPFTKSYKRLKKVEEQRNDV